MKLSTKLTELLQIEFPLIQAPMAGGVTTPELVAAVSNAGGLGSVGAGYMTPEQIREHIRAIRSLTEKPFAVNLFIDEPLHQQELDKIPAIQQAMHPFRAELGIDEPSVSTFSETFEEQLAVILEEVVPVFSFTFGYPAPELIQSLKKKGIKVIGTATSVREAIELEKLGVDAIAAQGSEAGGHRGTFIGEIEEALIGTIALIPQVVNHVQIPVIASGGIMDHRGIVAALALGASGVQMGTVFIPTLESGAHPVHQAALLSSTDQSTVLTRSFSGKYARGIKNRFIADMERFQAEIPQYPIQNALTRDIRSSAAKQNNPEYMSLWAGQGSALSQKTAVQELMQQLRIDTLHALEALPKLVDS